MTTPIPSVLSTPAAGVQAPPPSSAVCVRGASWDPLEEASGGGPLAQGGDFPWKICPHTRSLGKCSHKVRGSDARAGRLQPLDLSSLARPFELTYRTGGAGRTPEPQTFSSPCLSISQHLLNPRPHGGHHQSSLQLPVDPDSSCGHHTKHRNYYGCRENIVAKGNKQ